MKIMIYILILAMVTGCSSFQPIEMQSQELQSQLNRGTLVKVGDVVKVHKTDGTEVEFEIIDLNNSTLFGENVTVPVTMIKQIEVEQFSVAQTGLLALLIVGAIAAGASSGGAGLGAVPPAF